MFNIVTCWSRMTSAVSFKSGLSIPVSSMTKLSKSFNSCHVKIKLTHDSSRGENILLVTLWQHERKGLDIHPTSHQFKFDTRSFYAW